MRRFIRSLLLSLLAIAGVAGFGLVASCNITGSSSGGTGSLMMLMTDGPTDDWTEVTVHFLSASLHRKGADGWQAFWTANTADPASGKVNLVDLSGVSDILNAGTIPAGTYDRLKLVLNTSTAADSMRLVTADGAVIAPEDITVVDPSGTGEIKVDLDPDLAVEADGNNIVSIDFDLAHPLSIVNLDGKVVISLKVRHKALPRRLNTLQFARTLGDITAATANDDGTAVFTVKNLQGAEIEFKANANTIYTDVSSGAGAAGTFEGLKALAGTGAALVASNMNSDGSLYARRVWYADDIDKLPDFSPEGLVRRIGDTWLSVQTKRTEAMPSGDHHHRCDWDAETVFVNAETAWTFQGTDMGVAGLEGLAFVARGYRVEIVYVDENVTPKIAKSVNIQFAHAEGIVIEPTLDSFKLGWFWRTRTMVYSSISGREFGWWYYGLDSSRSTDRQALIDMVAAAGQARLWVFAWAGLAWDGTARQWAVENLVLAPLKLHEMTRITTAYTAASGSLGVSTYDCWDASTPEAMTIKLDTTGDLQTVVGSFLWRADTNLVTFTLPVPVGQWESLLATTVDKVRIWVRPVEENDGTFTWHAYCVVAYQFIR
ncbi:MAG TPA: DUF4382 domain-containing protein [Candidatus Aminicenantes bacterium]|nr:DUF4382 domain-containing protein [Candidatus Aminicenantes bacterium]HRY64006.1 DUF4382 domain-containing protein [Candidatus Aminicenantes bacterium]HRZ70919.1 DUF4382 domain-containing protein [Candidatus Aminicenantes bacterium]